MSAEMKQLVESCETCRQYNCAQPKKTLRSTEVPKRPWERIATDLFTYKGKEFLITVDYYSNFWEIDQLASTSASTVITKLKNHFARYGCPDTLVSDNGPQFTSKNFPTSRRPGSSNIVQSAQATARPTGKWRLRSRQQSSY